MKTFARVKKVENKLSLIIPNVIAREFQINDGDILELDLRKERIIVTKRVRL